MFVGRVAPIYQGVFAPRDTLYPGQGSQVVLDNSRAPDIAFVKQRKRGWPLSSSRPSKEDAPGRMSRGVWGRSRRERATRQAQAQAAARRKRNLANVSRHRPPRAATARVEGSGTATDDTTEKSTRAIPFWP